MYGLDIENFPGAGDRADRAWDDRRRHRGQLHWHRRDGRPCRGECNRRRITGGAGGNTIGGTTIEDRNVISGNTGDGIYISDGKMNVIEGNYIGVNKSGMSAIGNANGVYITQADSNMVGGTKTSDRNLISGNAYGGVFIGVGKLNVVEGNDVGPNVDGDNVLNYTATPRIRSRASKSPPARATALAASFRRWQPHVGEHRRGHLPL